MSGRSQGDWLKFFAFIAVMLLGLALMLSFIFSKMSFEGGQKLADVIKNIAFAIALVIPLVLSYYEARYHKSIVWFVLWIIAAILIVVFYILPWFF